MIYPISGGQSKDILVGDAVEIMPGVLDGVNALAVIDVSSSETILCAKIDFDTFQILGEPVGISPVWVTNIWRPV